MSTDFLTTLQTMRDGTYDYEGMRRLARLRRYIRAIASEKNYLGAEETNRRIAAVLHLYQRPTHEGEE